jgi:hypothetical protein
MRTLVLLFYPIMFLQIAQFLALPTQTLSYLFRAVPSCFEALGVQGKKRGELAKEIIFFNVELYCLLIHSSKRLESGRLYKHKAPRQRWPCGHPHPFRGMTDKGALTESLIPLSVFAPCPRHYIKGLGSANDSFSLSGDCKPGNGRMNQRPEPWLQRPWLSLAGHSIGELMRTERPDNAQASAKRMVRTSSVLPAPCCRAMSEAHANRTWLLQ